MARPTRRARAQAAARKRSEPNIPHHLMRRPGPATLEPVEEPAPSVQESDLVPPAPAPRVDRAFAERSRPAAAAPSPALSRAERAEQDIAARRSVTDYGYVIGELKRIFVTALIVVVALIIIALIRH